jgi:hypothetical protein
MRNLRIACKADHVSNIPLGELNLEKNKKEASEFKILFTIRGFNTYEGLSIYTTFRPIQSGATVPLSNCKSGVLVNVLLASGAY